MVDNINLLKKRLGLALGLDKFSNVDRDFVYFLIIFAKPLKTGGEVH